MKPEKELRRKVRHSYFISTVSISLVLYLLGAVSYLSGALFSTTDSLRSGITASVELLDECDSLARDQIRRRLEASTIVDSIYFVSKDEKSADQEFIQMFGSDFEELLLENPLRDSYEVMLTQESTQGPALDMFLKRTAAVEGVAHVSCPVGVLEKIDAIVQNIQLLTLLFGAALLVISMILLSNTIRLAIYSKRYVINTLKLVGATKWFIMRNFLGSSLTQGLLAGAMALLLLGLSLWGITDSLPEFIPMADIEFLAIIAGAVLLTGAAISVIFTLMSLNKFINMKSNKIHLY